MAPRAKLPSAGAGALRHSSRNKTRSCAMSISPHGRCFMMPVTTIDDIIPRSYRWRSRSAEEGQIRGILRNKSQCRERKREISQGFRNRGTPRLKNCISSPRDCTIGGADTRVFFSPVYVARVWSSRVDPGLNCAIREERSGI